MRAQIAAARAKITSPDLVEELAADGASIAMFSGHPAEAQHRRLAVPAVGADGHAARVAGQPDEHALAAALQPESLAVQDDSHLHAGHAGAREGRHFSVRIVSRRFDGLPRVARHRLVYDSLGSLGALGVHALAIDARTPDPT